MPQILLIMLTDNIIWIGSFPHSNTQGFWNHQLFFLPVESFQIWDKALPGCKDLGISSRGT